MYFFPAKYSYVPGWDFLLLPFSSKLLDAEGSEASVSRISAPVVLRVGRVAFGFGFTFCGSN